MPNERKEQFQKVIAILIIAGRSENTVLNYVHAINRFFEYVKNEDNILPFLKSVPIV